MAQMWEAFLAELEQEAAGTKRMLAVVPKDKFAYRPNPKSMSLGQLALHVAQLPGAIASFIQNDSFDATGVDFEPATPAADDDLLAILDSSVAQAQKVLRSFDAGKASTDWRLVKGDKTLLALPTMAIARSLLLNHWYHHRGQLTVYLRLLNVPVPATYGRSADENPLGL